jgi:hypothetical protein
MPSSAHLLKTIRLIHLYLGVFITPALIFFAFTGAVQTFSLHETTRGSSYKPPAILVELGQLHKKQTLVVPAKKPAPDAAPDKSTSDRPHPHTDSPASAPATQLATPPKPAETAPAKAKNLLPMKIFFLLVSIGLLTSTFTGLYMAYKYIRNKLLVSATLAAGIAVPILLLLI